MMSKLLLDPTIDVFPTLTKLHVCSLFSAIKEITITMFSFFQIIWSQSLQSGERGQWLNLEKSRCSDPQHQEEEELWCCCWLRQVL